jgi:glutathione S-transferase
MYDSYLQKMDAALRAHEWLAGDAFSLADISLAPYVNRLDMLGMADMWAGSRPGLASWFERIKARPTFKPCFLDYCPPDLTSDLRTYGSASWPEVRDLLKAG